MLEWAAAVGDICLKYLDESGLSLWSESLYTWAKIGEQKRIEPTQKKGRRLNICGLLEVGKSLEYGLALKSFKSESYIKLMNWQATQAEDRLKNRGQITVVVQDQGSIHISKLTKSHYKNWEKKGLYIFLLPSYSPELNRIENEWQRLKEDELAGHPVTGFQIQCVRMTACCGQMFEDEYELAIAVIEAIEVRQQRNGLKVERLRMN